MLRYAALLIILAACTPESRQAEVDQSELPNIVFILADDLGYGDIGLYGQQHFSTPNIDSIGIKGIQFMRHYSGSTVCAPSRSSLMTGQHTGHTPVRGNYEIQPEGQYPLAGSVYTLAEMLQDAGYVTGAFGKWGLGYPKSEGDPLNQGFDRFFGYNCQRLAHNYYPRHLWSDTARRVLTENHGIQEGVYAPGLIHQELLTFIESNRNRPFFAFVPTPLPHAELKVPEKKMAKFRNSFLPEKTYDGCDSGCGNFREGGYASQNESHAAFAGMISLLDDQVGEIMDKLNTLGILENTIVIFTSDNGPHLEGGADPDYFNSNAGLRGYKRDLYEGGIRVPLLVSWPGKIQAGRQSSHVSAFWDIFPTFMDLTGSSHNYEGDGISFLPELLNKPQVAHEHLYWEFSASWATPAQAVIIEGQWKAIRKVSEGQFMATELYDLYADPGENHNIASSNSELVSRANELFKKSHTPSDIEVWRFEALAGEN